MSAALKPCPFCGGNPVGPHMSLTLGSYKAYYQCSSCAAKHSSSGRIYGLRNASKTVAYASAVEHWNRRSPPAPADEAAADIGHTAGIRAAVGVTPEMVAAAWAEYDKPRPGKSLNEVMRAVLQAALSIPVAPSPIDLILHCPACHLQHIDAPEGHLAWEGNPPEPSHEVMTWENPPHRSHLCHGCGFIWRPADVPTNGVAAVKTKGKMDGAVKMTSITAADGEASNG